MENGFEIRSTDKQGKNVLQSSVQSGNKGLVQFLLEKIEEDAGNQDTDEEIRNIINCVDHDEKTILHYAVRFPDIIEQLLKTKINIDAVDKTGNSALHLAVQNGNLDSVKYLINANVCLSTVNNARYTALDYATELSRFDIQKLLTNKR